MRTCINCGLQVKKIPVFEEGECPKNIQHNFTTEKIVVAVSGYFTVFHIGHLKYLKAAKKLGDSLVVIVNNDKQQIRKKGKLIQSASDIAKVIKEFKFVDKVIISSDEDKTVCNTLRKLRPDIFAKGGDSTPKNVPELQVLNKIGAKIVFNVGGKKLNSSSLILQRID